MIVHNPDGTIDHDGEYDPWDMDAETKTAYLEAVSSGGFAFRIGYIDLRAGAAHRYVGDGLRIVRIVKSPCVPLQTA